MSMQEFIPVYLITGFLESGKTTLISGMLADEDFTRRSAGGKQKTLVIVCEEAAVWPRPLPCRRWSTPEADWCCSVS